MTNLGGMLLGSVHAITVGILLIAGAGKVAGCIKGSKRMCWKGAFDLALGVGVCSQLPFITPASLITTVLLGAWGWISEQIRGDHLCNCFGVFSAALSPWRNWVRAWFAIVGSVLFFIGGDGGYEIAGKNGGMVTGLLFLLFATALASAMSVSPTRRAITADPSPNLISNPELTLLPSQFVGAGSDLRSTLLGDIALPNKPLALIFSAPGCQACDALKQRLELSLDLFPFPVYILVEGENQSVSHHDNVLFDRAGLLRRSVGVRAFPSMVVVDGTQLMTSRPVAVGVEHIDRVLLDLLLKNSQLAEYCAECHV